MCLQCSDIKCCVSFFFFLTYHTLAFPTIHNYNYRNTMCDILILPLSTELLLQNKAKLIYQIQNTTVFQMSNLLMLKYVYPWQTNCFSVALWPRQSLNLLCSPDQGADSRKSDGWQRQPLALAEQAPLYHPSITLTAKEILVKFIYRALSRQKAEHISHQLKG